MPIVCGDVVRLIFNFNSHRNRDINNAGKIINTNVKVRLLNIEIAKMGSPIKAKAFI
jgi:hypothetical protein